MIETRAAYDELYRQIEVEVRRGEYRQALRLSRRALNASRRVGDPDLVHKAISNLSVIYLELGHPKRAERGLREIILRSANPTVICGAAYNLAICLRRQSRLERATSFAMKALEQARLARHSVWLSRCYNLIGNIRLCESNFDAALRHYNLALRVRRRIPEDTRFSRAILLDNIGYCWMLKKRYSKGIATVKLGLALAEEVDAKRCITESCQDLAFGYLKTRDLDAAASYGLRALELAEQQGYTDIARNCFYLLGEIYSLGGDEARSSAFFDRLQALYPHLPFLREFLRTFDVSDIIALKSP